MGFREFLNSLCCNCCSIEIGGYIVAGLEIAAAAVAMFTLGTTTAAMGSFLNSVDFEEEANKRNVTNTITKKEQDQFAQMVNAFGWTLFALYALHLIIALLFIIGLKKRKFLMMLPFLCSMALILIVLLVFSVLTVVGFFFFLPVLILYFYYFFIALGNFLNVKEGVY